MMGNPMQMIQMLKGGMQPQQIMQQIVQANPQARQYMPLIEGKSGAQLRETFVNLCQQRGLNPQDVLAQMGLDPRHGGFNK